MFSLQEYQIEKIGGRESLRKTDYSKRKAELCRLIFWVTNYEIFMLTVKQLNLLVITYILRN